MLNFSSKKFNSNLLLFEVYPFAINFGNLFLPNNTNLVPNNSNHLIMGPGLYAIICLALAARAPLVQGAKSAQPSLPPVKFATLRF